MKLLQPLLKSITFLIVCFLLTPHVNAQSNRGTIKGKVTTSDNQPASGVTVSLKGTKHGTLTADDGTFSIKAPSGSYTLVVSAVGLQSEEKQIDIGSGALLTTNFLLHQNAQQLKEVAITGQKRKYKIDNPSLSLRLNEPLLQVPQNIQVISNQTLSDQQVISASDGLIRNVSGAVRLEHWGDMYANITMRGSQIQAFRNGFNIVNSFWGPLTEDMSFVDHIEFVKGPAGFMLANGDPSGLYNVVTKKPTGQTKGEFGFTVGSYGLYRTNLDLDGKLSKDGKLLYRLNVAAQNKGSFRANEFNDRYSVAPVISYQIDTATKLTFEYVYQKAKMSDVGSFYVFDPNGYATRPRGFTALPQGLPPTNINDHSATVNLQHQLNPSWKLTAQAAYYNYNMLGSSLWVASDTVAADGRYSRSAGFWEAQSEMGLAQAFLNGKVTTGSIQHNILTGVDMGTKKYIADFNQSHALDTLNGGEFNPNDPSYPLGGNPPTNGFPNFDRSQPLESRAYFYTTEYTGLYFQDVLGFADNRVRLTLAGRYTYVKQDGLTGKRFTPRVGLSVSVDDHTSVYGLYDQAFMPQAAARLVTGGSVKPITGGNLEFGLKRDWADGKWNTTLSAYRIVKNNEAQADPSSTPANPVSFLLGQKVAKGIEFDIRGEVFPGLNLTANYALTDSRVSEITANTPQGISVGDIVPGYAKHVANAWLGYKIQNGILKNTGISGGFTYLANRATDTWSVGLQKLPNYFKLDGGLFWEGKKIRLTANAFNLLDAYLYSGSYYAFQKTYYYQAEAGRNYRLSISYKF
jgi:iron complex outermembrane receptor protein